MLRALAGLGVVHQPDFTEEMAMVIPDTIDQMTRSETSVETLEGHAAGLTLALMRNRDELEPELVHAARHAPRDAQRDLLLKLYELRQKP